MYIYIGPHGNTKRNTDIRREVDHVTKMNSLRGTEEETREAKEVGYVSFGVNWDVLWESRDLNESERGERERNCIELANNPTTKKVVGILNSKS